MSNAETAYDNFLVDIGKMLVKIDVNLAMQVMYYERKFLGPKFLGHYPSVDLDIHYKTGTNLEKKRYEFSSKYGYMSGHVGENGLIVKGNMDLKAIQEISCDSDIEKITGSASCACY